VLRIERTATRVTITEPGRVLMAILAIAFLAGGVVFLGYLVRDLAGRNTSTVECQRGDGTCEVKIFWRKQRLPLDEIRGAEVVERLSYARGTLARINLILGDGGRVDISPADTASPRAVAAYHEAARRIQAFIDGSEPALSITYATGASARDALLILVPGILCSLIGLAALVRWRSDRFEIDAARSEVVIRTARLLGRRAREVVPFARIATVRVTERAGAHCRLELVLTDGRVIELAGDYPAGALDEEEVAVGAMLGRPVERDR
jgi:hypothetical protein